MRLPDVNALIHAHREDAPEHEAYVAWLERLVTSGEPFALSSVTLSGFVRVVTHPKIFDPPTPVEVALAFCESLLARPRSVLIQPGAQHFRILAELIRYSGVRGPVVSDAFIAALAIEHGCEVLTTDGDFSRFGDRVRWRHPLARR